MNEPLSESIILGGGCFWCTEAAYKLVDGVIRITCGYTGGKRPNPSYEQVCSGATGHAEVIKIDFDPAQVTLGRLLDYFWTAHDPTQVGGQGNDEGTQYRSIIFYATEAQREAANKSLAEAQKRFRAPITTEIVPLGKFWPAEEYHQDYFTKHPDQGYCRVVIAPKIDHLKAALKPSAK